ncbi:50S ribosomal protein L9 [Nocardioides sp. REDSEA-S30_B4]|jgi:large subunit ribosomal protein L9|uniref:50S ribosomal protein L9 n=1 Tax=unclassified Nocardioides TaxID=2615069 RepID=UPI000AFCCFD3|nr:50S ribosomal protein L9 [Nocardioides sp. REDSEA-S30_B4]MAY97813.1 50S ribosomal protein L9 [Nocardioides sp.]MCK5928553.1 50S ribosomal protein L9 [Nocardioides sp.]MEC9051077.1 50S ribosomal protein L9 [Actinomycetota bacterium]|tara:strand:- start:1786 stop:2232 length:447 start_codon:yes stop_codon:yes gene_type:complete
MKLILTQEVTGLGGPGDVVEVKDGYGRNYLVPQGVAIRWTRGGEKTVESIKAARSSRAVRDLGHAEEVKAKIEGQTVNVSVKAGETGRLFGAVTVAEIAAAISEATGESVDKRTIAVDHAVRTLGSHQVTVRLHEDVLATVAINVVKA